MSVAQLLRDATARAPHAVALDGDGRRATFGELAEASNRVANALIAGGVQPGDRVGFVDRNGTEYWEVFLGALKAGAVLVPLNFRLAPAELDWALDDAGAGTVIVGAAYAASITQPVVTIGSGYEEWLAAAPDTDPGRDVVGPGLVQLIYSSGTTGRPKGVLVSAEQLLWSVAAFGSCFDVDGSSRSLVPIPYYHVAGGGWALVTLSRGGCVIQAREPTAASMLRQLVEHRVTHAALVPAVMAVLTQSGKPGDFAALRQVVYGGSPISEPLLRASVATLGAELFQSYGLSETMGVTTLLRPDQHRLRLRSAGRPVPGIELAVIDVALGRPLPDGEVGEVLVRGPSVTPGYWRNPDATAEALTVDGWFHTGDLGSLEDGFLYLRDRMKDLIITGGENVYPAEVESVLAAHPGVADVAVIGVPSQRWGETPIAVVVARGTPPEPQDVIDFARQRLAHFKCPTDVVFMDELPRNPSGKVLKRELRALNYRPFVC